MEQRLEQQYANAAFNATNNGLTPQSKKEWLQAQLDEITAQRDSIAAELAALPVVDAPTAAELEAAEPEVQAAWEAFVAAKQASDDKQAVRANTNEGVYSSDEALPLKGK